MRTLLLASTIGLLMSGSAALAHHSFSAEYDGNNPVTLNGTVTKVTWMRPHPTIEMKVDDRSNAGAWTVELGDVETLTHHGWKPTSLKMGDHVTVEGWQAKNGAKRANAKSLTLPGGSALNAASSFELDARGPASNNQNQTAATTGQTGSRTATPTSTRSASDVITVIGCVQRESEYRSQIADGKGGVAGSGVGAGNEVVLRSLRTVSNETLRPTATAGIAADEAYSVTGNLESEMARAVGRQVAASGYVETAPSQGTEKVKDLPRLNAAGWHIVSERCDSSPSRRR
jgi:hypothetical protein